MNWDLFDRIAEFGDAGTGGLFVSGTRAKTAPQGGNRHNVTPARPFTVNPKDLDALVESGLVQVVNVGNGVERYSLTAKGVEEDRRRKRAARARDESVGILRLR